MSPRLDILSAVSNSGQGHAICVAVGCTLKVSVKKHQLCEKHYQAFWKYGDPNGSGKRQGGPCSVSDCNRPRSSREGYCHMHRLRLLRTNSLERRTPLDCAEPECTRPAKIKGVCQRHYDLARGAKRNSTRICAVDGCNQIVKARGRCPRHYGELQRLGMLAAAPLLAHERTSHAPRECAEANCSRPTTPNGRCAIHHGRVSSGQSIERRCRGCNADLTGLPRAQRYCSDHCKPRCSGPKCARITVGRGLCSSHLKQHNAGTTLRPIETRTVRSANGPCKWCGDPVGARSTSSFCTLTCRNLARRHAVAATTGECAQCGAAIDYLAPANNGGKRLTPVSKRLCDDCRHRSASLYMSAEDLRKRDGGNCALCGLPVPTDAIKPHPLAPEVDHILPISRGGTHEPDNLALVHKTCNITKSNKPARWMRDP